MVMLNWTGSIAERKSWYEKLKRMLAPYNISHEMFEAAAYAAFVGWEDENLIAILEGKQPAGKFNENEELIKCRAKVLRLKGANKEAEILEKLWKARIEENFPNKSLFNAVAVAASRSPTSLGAQTTLPSFSNFHANGAGGPNPATAGMPVLLPLTQQLPGMTFPSMAYPPIQFPQFLPTTYYSPPTTPVLFPMLPPPSNLMATKSGSPIELAQPLISPVGYSPSTSASQFSSSASSSAFLSHSPNSSPSRNASSPSSSVSSSPVRESTSKEARSTTPPPAVSAPAVSDTETPNREMIRSDGDSSKEDSSSSVSSDRSSPPPKSNSPISPTSISNLTNSDTDKSIQSPNTTNTLQLHPETRSSEIARK
eukprot:TRINITY_DN2756_c0_g1_i4.p1 TRINITY_DN2756_c0_g1~~TRINITY_DN2756_c0_g1_i4.p1  ORF type:complete len:368 (+),score=82.46 TRINITY_DN2756_c0_g1_i4:1079-2182(+)